MISRRILAAVAVLCAMAAPAHAQKTKAQLTTEIGTTFPDNVVGAITPAGVRAYETDVLNSIMPTAPVVAGNLACFNGTTGLLQDCGSAPTTVPLTVGTTPINGGTTTRVLFDNGGRIGEYTISGSGSVCMTTSCAMTSPNLDTPTAITLTNGTGLPISTGVSGLGTGVATFLATPNSANLATAITDQTGTGVVVYSTSPTLVTPTLGVATATSVNKVAITAPATSATLTIANGTTLTETTSTSVGQGQYLGTNTNDNATAGNVGEYVESVVASGAATALTTATAKTVTSISLTAGDWDVSGNVGFVITATTAYTLIAGSISLTTNTVDTTNGRSVEWAGSTQTPGNTFLPSLATTPLRFSLSTTTTVFLVAQANFSASTMSGYGIIRARRVR